MRVFKGVRRYKNKVHVLQLIYITNIRLCSLHRVERNFEEGTKLYSGFCIPKSYINYIYMCTYILFYFILFFVRHRNKLTKLEREKDILGKQHE